MTVVATGSIAFDYILRFQGHFGEHFVADMAHTVNLSFLVDRMEKRRGGVAANYAYTMALLGQPAAILATAGGDAVEYREWLQSKGIDCSGMRILADELSATGFTTVDLDENQLTGYYGGAMLQAGQLGLADTSVDPAAVIVGPNAPDAMARLIAECRAANVRWIYDPAHQLPMLSAAAVVEAARGSWILIGNEYEIELVQQRTGLSMDGLLELTEHVVTTLSAKGARIATRSGTIEIPVAPAREMVDPVGAGDAFRAGLAHGLLAGRDLEEAGRIASLCGAYVVEQVGTVEHAYTREEFELRYRQAFGAALS
jgi:adenosine kinase